MRFCLAVDHGEWWRCSGPRPRCSEMALAVLADHIGLDSLWLNEDPDGWDAFAILGAIAAVTSRLRLGPGVTNPYQRHPNLLAASVATLDRLSHGRAFLGLGRGQPEWHTVGLGLPPYPPLSLLEETVQLLDQWWTPPFRASASGPILVQNWERSVHPAAPPPRYLAAAGPKALRLAGRLFDGVLFNELASVPFMRQAIATARQAAIEAGRDPASLSFFANPAVVVTDDPEPILERKKALIATVYVLPGMERLLDVPGFDVPGLIARLRALMRVDDVLARGGGFPELRRAGDLAAARALVPTDLVAQLAIVGTLDSVRSRLADLEVIGVTHVFLDRHGLPRDPEAAQSLLAMLQQRSES
ncbi:MAG: LLM class flavin-dependent oxidoreductase [Chloroflexota bacterium]